MPSQTFPHEADIGVRGTGATLEEAFVGAALALTAAICDPTTVAQKKSVSIDCAAPDVELLLVDWFNALIYRMTTRHLLFSRFEVSIAGTRLHATAWGEAVDVARHQPAAEAKGVSVLRAEGLPAGGRPVAGAGGGRRLSHRRIQRLRRTLRTRLPQQPDGPANSPPPRYAEETPAAA